jgi:hypothetical protein
MQRTVYDAGRGLSTAVDALADLGLSIGDLGGLAPEEQFKLLGDALNRIGDPTKKAALAMVVFGRSGTALLPMFSKGAAGINELQQKFRDLGITMSQEDIDAAVQLTDTMDSLVRVLKFAFFSIGGALVPVLEELAEKLIVVSKPVTQWIKDNKGLVVSIAKLVAGFTAFGIALTVLGTIIGGVGSIIGVFATVLGLALTPVGLVITAIALMGGAIVKYTDAGGQAIQWLGGQFDFLRQDAETAFNGIADALAAGSTVQAAKILWLTLKMEWLRGVTYLQDMWSKFTGFIAKVMIGAFTVLSTTANIFVFGLEAALVSAANGFMKAWGAASDWVAKRLIEIKGLIDGTFDAVAAKAQIDLDAKVRSEQMDARLADVGARFDAGLSESGEWNKEARAGIDEGVQAEMNARKKELAAAQQEWQQSIQDAKAMRESVGTGGKGKPGEAPPPFVMPEIEPLKNAIMDLGDVGEIVQKATVTSKGTFSAFAAYGLGVGSGVEDRTAKAVEDTAKNTRDMLKEMKNNKLVFES